MNVVVESWLLRAIFIQFLQSSCKREAGIIHVRIYCLLNCLFGVVS